MSAASFGDPAGLEALATVEDAAITALAEGPRMAAARAWSWRASSERTASEVFARIAEGLRLDGATEEVERLASAAVEEERAHAQLAHAVACRYAREILPAPAVRTLSDPRFGDADARTNRLLFLVLHCCVNETIAATYLRRCLREARGPVAHGAVRRLLGDEINHARIGWAHLASRHVSEVDRGHVANALGVLLRLARAAWSMPIPETEQLESGHGALTEPSSHETVEEAMEQVVLPGLVHVGIRPHVGR